MHLYIESMFIYKAFVVNVFACLIFPKHSLLEGYCLSGTFRFGVEDYCSIFIMTLTPLLQRKLLKCFLYMVEVQTDSTMILFTILMISSC